jgi:hypothetical protein
MKRFSDSEGISYLLAIGASAVLLFLVIALVSLAIHYAIA